MLQRGLIFVIPNAVAESLMGFGDAQGGHVQKIVTFADCEHLRSNTRSYTNCLKTLNEGTSEDDTENDPGQQLQLEKRVIPRRLDRWEDFYELGSKKFFLSEGKILFFEFIFNEIAEKGKGVILNKLKALFKKNTVKLLEKFIKAKIPEGQKNLVDPLVNFGFTFVGTGVKLIFFKGFKKTGEVNENGGITNLDNWAEEFHVQVQMKIETLLYTIIKKLISPLEILESLPDKFIGFLVEEVTVVKIIVKKIAMTLKYQQIDDECAKSGKDECASPTPICEWNPKTDKCGIRESLLLKLSKDTLSWVFWKIVVKYGVFRIKKHFRVEDHLESLRQRSPWAQGSFERSKNGSVKVTESMKLFAELSVYLFALEVLSAVFAESKMTKETPEEKSEEKPEEEPKKSSKGTLKKKSEKKPKKESEEKPEKSSKGIEKMGAP